MAGKDRPQAIAYLRTSSAANVEGDSAERQRIAIRNYANRAGLKLAAEFYDAAVSGADPVEDRPGFRAMLDRIDGNGVRLVLVEDASRFARTVVAQELGLAAMMARGVRVFAANGDELTDTDDEARVMVRQVLGAFAQMEKTRLVKKLAAARARVRAATGRCEGRKPVIHGKAEKALRRLARRNPRTGQRRSLREIAAALANEGHVSASGRPFGPEVVRTTIARLRIGES